jgi:hypothetical protein
VGIFNFHHLRPVNHFINVAKTLMAADLVSLVAALPFAIQGNPGFCPRYRFRRQTNSLLAFNPDRQQQ